MEPPQTAGGLEDRPAETPSPPQEKLRAQGPTRVLVAWNHTELSENAELDEPSDEDIGELLALIAGEGYEVLDVNAEDNCDRLGDAVVVFRPDMILNLLDHFHGDTLLAPACANLLEIFEYPFTGGNAHAISGCQDRLRSRLVLRSAGITVPEFACIWKREDVATLIERSVLRFPLVFTQSYDDIYHREDCRGRIEEVAELREAADEVFAEYEPPFLVEEYLEETTLAVIVIDGQALDPCAVTYDEDAVSFELASLGVEERDQLGALAVTAATVLGARDWAQVDIVLDASGQAFVTDVRPLLVPFQAECSFSVAAPTFPGGAGAAIAKVIESALSRARKTAALATQLGGGESAVADGSVDAQSPDGAAAPSETASDQPSVPEPAAAETTNGPTDLVDPLV